ncbi:MAG: hypothetical protein J0L56_11280 [Chitinophagales bacterium]|nr:hypothetical protein [Chitinophagales bacterium]
MKGIKYICSLALLLTFMPGCKKEENVDTAFVATAAAPDQLSMLFEITQDNTGLVTITPNGLGVATYDVYYGHGAITPNKVMPGKKITHIYPEGVYTVRLVAHNLNGKTTEITKQLTVSFRAPENLDVISSIDPGNNFRLNVTATALYETSFRVYFGDVPNEVPLSFNEGQTVSHTYAATGTYTLRVVALSGGAATTQMTRQITIVDPVLLPLTFESPTVNYSFTNFGGGVATVINNPQVGGINSSTKVGRMVKNAPEVWAGSFISLDNAIDFSVNKIFRMKVFSPRVGAKVLLKVENATNGGINFEKEVTITQANAWEDLAFDFSAINTANSYHKVVLIFELGTAGNGSPDFTFLFDDIRLTNVLPGVVLPLNFESSTLTYTFTNFGGANTVVGNNPNAAGINTSAKAGALTKGNGAEVWAGSFIELSDPIDFSTQQTIKMKVWSPQSGITVKFKMENLGNPGINIERDATTTVANGWEELTFNFAGINTANNYQRVVVFFDFGNPGTGATYYFDDIRTN